MEALEYIVNLYRKYCESDINRTISPLESMNDEHYWVVGESALQVIVKSCISAQLRNVENILDLPCGHGRVLRHLSALFPQADIYACDLDSDGVRFCETVLGAIPIKSSTDLSEVAFPVKFDLIWVGSLFTHTSQSITRSWLKHLANQLTDNGIIVATFHGRWSEKVHGVLPYLGDDAWQKVLEAYQKDGYGYSDYSVSENHTYMTGSYGVSLARPHALISAFEEIPDVRIIGYTERAWGDHQDVAVLGKPEWDKKWPGM